MTRDLVLQDGTSNKFWRITTDGSSFTVTFGRVGTAGQSQTKKFPSDDACDTAAAQLVAEKVKKGYVDAKGAVTKPAAPKPAAKPPPKRTDGKKLSSADAKALIRAIELGLMPKVKAFCAKGSVDVVVPLKHGRKTTPLFAAAGRNHAEMVAVLLEAGGNVTGVDEYGQSVLHRARDIAVATKLLDAGADVRARDKTKSTPLHAAAESGDPALVQLFVDHGAEIDAKDAEGKSPYVGADNFAVRTLLKKLGAKGLDKTDGGPLEPKKRAAKPDEVDVDGGAIAVAEDGSVWIGGTSAIFRWDGKKVTAFEFEESFSVSQIAPGAEDRVYFSTNWGLVVRSGDAWRLYRKENSELHDQHITDMAVDRRGRACVMGYGGEEKVDRPISVFDGKDFTLWTAGADFPTGLETNRITFDAKNRIVHGTESGVVFADGTKWKVPGESGILSSVNVLVADGDTVWAGAPRGVHRVTTSGQSTTSIKTPSGTSCVLVDGSTIWIGMSYGGLLRVRGSEQKHFKDQASGLEEDDVEGLALGKDGTVWIAAGNAVFQCRGDAITRFEGQSSSAKTAPAAKKPEPEPKKRKVKPLPAEPLVPRAKFAPHVVKAIEGAKLEGLTTAALFRLVRPAIGLMIDKAATAVAVGGSKLGGRPDLAPGVKWPTYRHDGDRFLPFLFQINLADIAKHDLEDLLPKKGRLSFFCDTQPDEIGDSRVVFDDGTKKAARPEWPEDLVDRKDEDDFVAQLPEHALEVYPTWTLPSAEYLGQHLELTDVDHEALSDLETKLHALDPKRSSTTRLLGWPDTLQGEIVSSPDEIILLQIDGEMPGPKKLAELLAYWGNGVAHFVIKRSDLEAKKLGKVGAELAYT